MLATAVTDQQIEGIKYLVFKSKDSNDLAKQILALLIDNSEHLTREVCLTLIEDREGFSEGDISEAAGSFESMMSSNGSTHIDAIFSSAGCDLHPSVHYGDYDPSREGNIFNNDGQFAGIPRNMVQSDGIIKEGMPMRYTFWLSRELYSRQAALLVTTRTELEAINLRESGLYPNIGM